MLIIISDLHLSDGTSGKHSPPPEAFDLFVNDIKVFTNKLKPQNVTLLLLGDIFDVLRSTKWFESGGISFSENDRPWGKNGLKDINSPVDGSATEQRCLDILGKYPTSGQKRDLSHGSILYENWEILEKFRNFKNEFGAIPAQIVYVPGNHDRLCNLYPSVRNEIARILYGPNGVTPSNTIRDGDKWWFDYQYHDPKLKVFARHGHQYDIFNYGALKTFDRKAHLQASIGDVITTEFAVRIPWQVEYNNKKGGDPSIAQLAKRLQDMDNIRPLGAALKWFYYKVRSQQTGNIRESLDRAFDDVAQNMLNLEFVQKWNSPHTHIDEAVRVASSPWVKWISERILKKMDVETLLPIFLKFGDGSEDRYLDGSHADMQHKSDVDYIIYGHTHNPLHQPMDVIDGRDVFYLNSGTWRRRVIETSRLDKSPDFVSVQAMTYVTIYQNDGKINCDMWSGMRK